MPATSLPACGSERPNPARSSPVGDAREVAPLLVLVAGDQDRPDRQPGQQEHQGGGVRVLGHLLDGDGQPEDPGARPSELGGQAQPEQVGVPERLEEVVGYSPVASICAGPRLDLVLGQPADALLERGELGREVEVHGRRGYPRGATPSPGRSCGGMGPRSGCRDRDPRHRRVASGARFDRGSCGRSIPTADPRASSSPSIHDLRPCAQKEEPPDCRDGRFLRLGSAEGLEKTGADAGIRSLVELPGAPR